MVHLIDFLFVYSPSDLFSAPNPTGMTVLVIIIIIIIIVVSHKRQQHGDKPKAYAGIVYENENADEDTCAVIPDNYELVNQLYSTDQNEEDSKELNEQTGM